MKQEDFLKYYDFIFSIIMQFDKINNIKTDEDIKNYIIKNLDIPLDINYQRRLHRFLIERLTMIFYYHTFKNPLKVPIIQLSKQIGETFYVLKKRNIF